MLGSTIRRWSVGTLLTVALAVLLTAAPAFAASSTHGTHASGSRIAAANKAVAGALYRVTADRLKPGLHVTSFIRVTADSGCCKSTTSGVQVVPRSGRVTFTFAWPTQYYICDRDRGRACRTQAWSANEPVVVGVDAADLHARSAAGRSPRALLQKTIRVEPAARVARPSFRTAADERAAASQAERAGVVLAHKCSSPWMSSAQTVGTGFGFEVSFVPTDRTRYLARDVPGAYGYIWDDLQQCVPFPIDLNGYQLDSLYKQMECHVLYGVFGLGGVTFDFEAWRPDVSLGIALNVYSYRCNWDLGPNGGDAYLGHIVQWNGDTKAQKTAWLVVGTPGALKRNWIPDSSTYGCLTAQGAAGPDQLPHSFLDRYLPDATGVSATCSPPQVAPPTPAPPTQSPPAQTPPTQNPPPQNPPNPQIGVHIEDDYLGGTWARTDPNDGTWHSRGNPPANGAYWYPNGLGVAVDCERQAAPYVVSFADGHRETWFTWFHVTDGKWYPSAASQEIWSDGPHGLNAC